MTYLGRAIKETARPARPSDVFLGMVSLAVWVSFWYVWASHA
jgi:hypothetical protein